MSIRWYTLLLLLFTSVSPADVDSISVLIETGDELNAELGSIGSIDLFTVDESGNIQAVVTGSNSDKKGLIQRPKNGGGVSLIAFEGQDNGLIDPPFAKNFGSRFTNISNGGGAVSFVADCEGGCNSSNPSVWRFRDTELEILTTFEGTTPFTRSFPADNLNRELNSVLFDRTIKNLQVNDQGRTLFIADFQDNTSISNRNEGIWVFDALGLRPIIIENSAAPGVDGMVFRSFDNAVYQDNGDILFTANIAPAISQSGSSAQYLFDGTSLTLLTRFGDEAPGTGGLVVVGGGKFTAGKNGKYLVDVGAKTSTVAGGAATRILYFGDEAGGLQNLLPAPDNFGRFNIETTNGQQLSFNESAGIFGEDGDVYLNGGSSAFDNIFSVGPGDLGSYDLLFDSNTPLPGLETANARNLSLLEVGADGTILFSATQGVDVNYFVRGTNGQFLGLPSVGDALGEGVVGQISNYSLALDDTTKEVNFLATIINQATSETLSQGIYSLVFSFAEISNGFFWDGNNCSSNNWHDECGGFNFDDEGGVQKANLPGDADDVVITDADVVIDQQAVSVSSIQSAGSLQVSQPLTLASSSSIENLDLMSELSIGERLTVQGESNWRAGDILGEGVLEVAGVLNLLSTEPLQLLAASEVKEQATVQNGELNLSNDLTVLDSGELTLAETTISAEQDIELVVNGALKTTGEVVLEVPLVVTEASNDVIVSNGTLTLNGGGVIEEDATIEGLLLVNSDLEFRESDDSPRIDGKGTVRFRDTSITVDGRTEFLVAEVLLLDDNSIVGGGEFSVSGRLEVDSLVLDGELSTSGTLFLKDGSTITGGVDSELDNDGEIVVEPSSVVTFDVAKLDGTNKISVGAGSTVLNRSVLTDLGGEVILESESVFHQQGDLNLMGDLTVSGGGEFLLDGVSAVGVLSDLTIAVDTTLKIQNDATPTLTIRNQGETLFTEGNVRGQFFNFGSLRIAGDEEEVRILSSLRNSGTVEQEEKVDSGFIVNEGNYEIQADLVLTSFAGFNNTSDGTLRKIGEEVVTISGRQIANEGSIEVSTGELILQAQLLIPPDVGASSSLVALEGATLTLRGGLLQVAPELIVSGSGLILFDSELVPSGTRAVTLSNAGRVEWRSGQFGTMLGPLTIDGRPDSILNLSNPNAQLFGGFNSAGVVNQSGNLNFTTQGVIGGTSQYNLTGQSEIDGEPGASLLVEGVLNVFGSSIVTPEFTNNGAVNLSSDARLIVQNYSGIQNGVLTAGNWNLGANASASLLGEEFVISEIGPGASVSLGPGATLNNYPVIESDFTVTNAEVSILDELTVMGRFTNNGGTISGSGTITTNELANSGVVAPGTSPGVLTIVGDYTQSASGTLDTELAGTSVGTEHDQLNVSGVVTFETGARINVTLIDGFLPQNRSVFDILLGADIQVSEALENLVVFTNSPTEVRWNISILEQAGIDRLRLEVLLGTRLSELTELNFADASVASAIDDASLNGEANEFFDFSLAVESGSVAAQRQALENLRFDSFPQAQYLALLGFRRSTELVPSRASTGAQLAYQGASDSRQLAQSLNEREWQGFAGDYRLTISGAYESGDLESTIFGQQLDYTGTSLGMFIDRDFDHWRVGLGITRSSFDGDESADEFEHNADSLILFSDLRLGGLTMDAQIALGRGELDTERQFSVGNVNLATQAEPNTEFEAQSIGLRYAASYQDVNVVPFVEVSRFKTDIEAFREAGSISSLVVAESSQRYRAVELGLDADMSVMGSQISVGVSHEWMNAVATQDVAAGFTASSVGSFTLPDQSYDDDAWIIRLGLNHEVKSNLDFSLGYESRLGAQSRVGALSGRMHWLF